MPESASPIEYRNDRSSENPENAGFGHLGGDSRNGNSEENRKDVGGGGGGAVRTERPTRACTQLAAVRMQAAIQAEAAMAEKERKMKKARKKERVAARLLREVWEDDDEEGMNQEENGEEGGAGSPFVFAIAVQ